MARLYGYNTRIADRYNRQVVSLAVLADDDPAWRPDTYEGSLWGWSVRMTFPVAKVLDYADRETELEASRNPFAWVVLAHLKTLETRRDPATRQVWKFRLVRGLYERGFSAEDIRQLLRLIDWLMELPPPLEDAFQREHDAFVERLTMQYVTPIERHYMARVIERFLRRKFGEEGIRLVPSLPELDDEEKYHTIIEVILTTTSTLDDVRQAIAAAAAPRSRRRKKTGRSKGDQGEPAS